MAKSGMDVAMGTDTSTPSCWDLGFLLSVVGERDHVPLCGDADSDRYGSTASEC